LPPMAQSPAAILRYHARTTRWALAQLTCPSTLTSSALRPPKSFPPFTVTFAHERTRAAPAGLVAPRTPARIAATTTTRRMDRTLTDARYVDGSRRAAG